VTNFDIDAFTMALIDSAAYAVLYPGCSTEYWEPDGDGRLANLDIDPFASLLLK
jgi:hypothetical protein